MNFTIHALPQAPFAPLFDLDDAALAERRIRRVVADGRPLFPCRVSLQDATQGETLLLLPFDHHPVDTPYRASGPVYVRRDAEQALPETGEVPSMLRTRLLSVRAYSAQGMLLAAEVEQGTQLEQVVERLFAEAKVGYVHVHFARPGCYACRIERG